MEQFKKFSEEAKLYYKMNRFHFGFDSHINIVWHTESSNMLTAAQICLLDAD